MSRYVCLDVDSEIRCALGTGVTPEEAYWNYVECKALTGYVTEWHKYQPRPEPRVNITYIDPKEMGKVYST